MKSYWGVAVLVYNTKCPQCSPQQSKPLATHFLILDEVLEPCQGSKYSNSFCFLFCFCVASLSCLTQAPRIDSSEPFRTLGCSRHPCSRHPSQLPSPHQKSYISLAQIHHISTERQRQEDRTQGQLGLHRRLFLASNGS